jgi:hypothetical protein
VENIIEEITKLTNEWYILIGPTHHKDKCCHWYIETKWSYGQPPKYSVQHHGYILHDFDEIKCSSYEEALIVLAGCHTLAMADGNLVGDPIEK